jgi:tRNA-specific 2-thiouridylase
VADKAESQEICFIPDNNYGEFIKRYIPKGAKPGPIVNKTGKVIGEHRGVIFYTIGQRKRIGIADKQPLYVVAIDEQTNTVVVGKKEEVYSNELIADNVNFIGVEKPKIAIRVKAKIRYHHRSSPATVIPLNKGRFKVKFKQPQWAITPGQAVVFYQPASKQGNGDFVVGGGTIASSKNN